MNFSLSLPVAAAIVAAAILPLLLALMGHGPKIFRVPGRRFVVAAGVVVIGWSLATFSLGCRLPDFVAGGLILLGALLAEFTLWTLVAWGFTLTMLTTIADENEPISLDDWIRAYTGGRDVEAFAEDRLGVLFRLKMAKRHEGFVVSTPGRGANMAKVARLLQRMFGLHP